MNAHANNLAMVSPIPLSERAMLANVTIRAWSGRKLDKRVTAETNRQHNAKSDAGRYNKLLVARDAIAEIARIGGKARNDFYRMTLPWLDIGGRCLPAAIYDRFMAEQRAHHAAFDKAVSALVAAFPDYVADARIRLGSMFDAADYPDAAAIAAKHGFVVSIAPLPDAADFRIARPDQAAIQAEIERQTSAAIDAAMRDVWERVAETVGHMAEKLAAYQPGGQDSRAQNVFRDSLVENMRDLVSMLPGFNVASDPRLDALASMMERHLCAAEASELRDNAALRRETAQKAARIAETVSQFMA